MDVSKNRGTPKWMVKIMENPIKMDDLGGKPTIFGNTHMYLSGPRFGKEANFPYRFQGSTLPGFASLK